MNRHLFIAGLVGLLTATAACSPESGHVLLMPDGNGDSRQADSTRCEILLSATNLEARQGTTRSDVQHPGVSATASKQGVAGSSLPQGASTRSEQLANGQAVYVWADAVTGNDAAYSTTTANYISDWQLTADGEGGLNGESRYFPANGNSLRLFALHGSFGDYDTEMGSIWTTGLTHTVATDQTTASPASDLLYAVSAVAAPGGLSQTVDLPFHHLLAKVRVALSSEGADALTEATLKIDKGGGTVVVIPNKGLTPATIAASAAGAAMLGTHTPQDVRLPIVDWDDFSSTPTHYGEAVVVPQAYDGTNALLTVTVDGADAAFIPDAFSMSGGYVYTFHITVLLDGTLRLASAITPWDDGDLDADPEPGDLSGETVITPWKTGSLAGDNNE